MNKKNQCIYNVMFCSKTFNSRKKNRKSKQHLSVVYLGNFGVAKRNNVALIATLSARDRLNKLCSCRYNFRKINSVYLCVTHSKDLSLKHLLTPSEEKFI